MTPDDWQPLMTQWNVALLSSSLRAYLPSKQVKTKWLGQPGAAETDIAALESRIGRGLPPSYRSFLQFSNGWGALNSFIEHMWSTNDVDWFSTRNQDWIDAWNDPTYGTPPPVADEEYLQYGEEQTGALRHEYLKTALEISDTGDSAILLLNPQIVTPDGEWEAWFFANWLPGARRYPSFRTMMEAEYTSFVELEAEKTRHDQQERVLRGKKVPFDQKVEVLIEQLRSTRETYATLAEGQSADPVSTMYPQGIVESLQYVEAQLVSLQALPVRKARQQFQVLLRDVESRWTDSQQTAFNGFNSADALSTLLREPTMADVQQMVNRMANASNGEGYRIALNILRGVGL